MSTSGIDLAKPLVSGSNCKLVFFGICSRSLEMSHWRLLVKLHIGHSRAGLKRKRSDPINQAINPP